MDKVIFAVLLTQVFFLDCDSFRLHPPILNGNEVETITQFPFQVAIFAKRASGVNLSSGAIISAKFILTCAHCIKNSANCSIYYGMTSFDDVRAENYQVISSSNYRIHPNYTSFRDDIAIMLTTHDIQFSDKVQPVHLPSRSTVNSDSHERLQLAAWGMYSNAQQTSNALLYADVQLLSTSECTRIFGADFFTEKVTCSRTLHCSGDSGSVLVERDNDDVLAVGIASFANYQTCTESDSHASAYMRVASYLDFIEEHTNLISD